MRFCKISTHKAGLPSSWSVTATLTLLEDSCQGSREFQAWSSTSQTCKNSALTELSLGSSKRQRSTRAMIMSQIPKWITPYTISCSRSLTGIRTSLICFSGSSHESLKTFLKINPSWGRSLRYRLPLGYRCIVLFNNLSSSRFRRVIGTSYSQLKTR